MQSHMTRRELFAGLGAASLLKAQPSRAASAPTAPVAVGQCRTYGSELLPTLERMFDQLGGLGRIVKNKTVAIKLNLTGSPHYRMGYRPAEVAHWTHPAVTAATSYLMSRAGARRIRLLECCWSTAEPLEEYMIEGGWDPSVMLNAAPNVEFENTNWLGKGKKYSRFMVPGGGYIYKGFDLNHSFEDCDVFCSIAKLKEHATAGITLSMKNCFGNTPATIYGDGAGKDEPSECPRGGRNMFHRGHRQPSGWMENDTTTPRDGGYRVPRIVVDIVAARPIDLAIVEGIESMTVGEGPWIQRVGPISPGSLVAGTNSVTTDAVATALMGFDPMADRGTAPFERCDSTLRLAEDVGLGTRDPKRIEVLGVPIEKARVPFRVARPT
jgi:uncharacterized protein (DUF362 family)